MPRFLTYGLLALLAAVHIVAVGKLTDQHAALQKIGDQNQLFTLPSPILKVAALDYKGIVSDFLFVKGMVYLGGITSQKGAAGQFRLTESQWLEFYHLLDVSTDLDPYFQDPYYTANAFLTWDAGMAREANILLEKGSRYRDWDWTLPFFSGFNFFYFLQENENAAEKLMEASRRPGASPSLASLASKLAFQAKRTESSIVFLEEIIRKTDDESMKKLFVTRVEAFRSILALERAIDDYRKKFGKSPANVGELVKKRIITEIPVDPYGGKFYLDPSGSVKSTTERELMPHRKQ